MMSPDPIRLEAAIDQLSLSDKLWLIERLARRIRERSVATPVTIERGLEEMANDPSIQRELREIEAEFAMIEHDDPEAHS